MKSRIFGSKSKGQPDNSQQQHLQQQHQHLPQQHHPNHPHHQHSQSAVAAQAAPYPQAQANQSGDLRSTHPPHFIRPDPNQPIIRPQDSQTSIGRSPSLHQRSQQQLADQHQQQYQQAGYDDQQQYSQRPVDQNYYRHSTYVPGQQVPTQHHQPEEKARRGLRDRLGLGSHKQGEPSSSGGGVGRKLSVRRKGSPNPDKFADAEGQKSSPYNRLSNHSQQLLSPTEEDEESQHNRFVQSQQNQYGGRGPPVPRKDGHDQQGYPQQLQQQPQDYYPPPQDPLQSGHDQQYQPQGSAEDLYLTPEQQLQLQQQQGGQYAQYQNQHPQQVDQQYQHYPAPGQEAHEQDQQGPPPGYDISTADQQAAHQQDRVSLEGRQPPHFGTVQGTPSLDQARQTSKSLALHQPQPQRATDKEGLFLQAPGTQGHNPPSPFPAGEQGVDQERASIVSPPSPDSYRSAPSPMPPPSRSGGVIRPVDGKSMHSSSRDSSLTAQHPQDTRSQRMYPSQQEAGGDRNLQPQDLTEDDVAHYQQLVKDHKELKEKYQKVKKYYFEKESQVHQLQNTLANQRLSASRTSLDDSEYSARFSRLDGLISQLSFSIRKSWTSIPEWLHRTVNKDALQTGKQEMTAVGRSFISNWLYLELFERIFHPDLDPANSVALKQIYLNLRRFAPPCTNAEEEEALASKLAAWRMATVEGLQDQLRSPAAAAHREDLVAFLNAKLCADIGDYLIKPPPPDLEGGVHMIVELATGIASHLPMESRDVAVEYYAPLYPVVPEVMKLESGIPQLLAPIVGPDPSSADADDDDRDDGSVEDATQQQQQQQQPLPPPKDESAHKSRRGMLANLMNAAAGAPPASSKPGAAESAQKPSGSSGGLPPSAAGAAATAQGGKGANGRGTPTAGAGGKEERVRMAVGLAVVIRGRSVLVRAPVFVAQV